MHHQHLVATLERHLPPSCTVHPKKRLVKYMEPEEEAHSMSPIKLEFTDGTCATTDILIGADGIRSAVRKTMFEAASKDSGDQKADLKQFIEATFTGMSVYRALVPAETLGKETPENASLKDMTMVSIRLRSAKFHTSHYQTVHGKGQGRPVCFCFDVEVHSSTNFSALSRIRFPKAVSSMLRRSYVIRVRRVHTLKDAGCPMRLVTS